MQEGLIEYKGIVCDYCSKPSTDHTYHQVTIRFASRDDPEYDVYLCTKCYKSGKAKEFD